MANRDEVVEFWDAEIGRWARGDHSLHPDLSRWLSSYRGRGAGTVDLTVLPEPYIGPLATNRTPALVMLGLNPGAAAPAFQSMTGIYSERIRQSSYGQWAATGPYSDQAWESVNGRNTYQQNRVSFARRLHQDASIEAKDLLYVELYPFHSARVTAPIVPPPDLLARFVLKPIADLDVQHVFAFGKPWLTAARLLGLGDGSTLPVQWATSSRDAREFRLNNRQSLIVMTQLGYAGPPGAIDTEALAATLARH